MNSISHDTEYDLALDTEELTTIPSLFKVSLLNDDFTPMDFVVDILQQFFAKSEAEAVQIMLAVHEQGRGECGIYTLEIAETRVNQVCSHAQQHGHPLQCILEPV